jgi:hypothetical protein
MYFKRRLVELKKGMKPLQKQPYMYKSNHRRIKLIKRSNTERQLDNPLIAQISHDQLGKFL